MDIESGRELLRTKIWRSVRVLLKTINRLQTATHFERSKQYFDKAWCYSLLQSVTLIIFVIFPPLKPFVFYVA